MALNRADVEKIAHLARLQVDEHEAKTFADSLSRILELVEQMNAVDTTGVTPMAHPQEAALRLREDRATEADEREKCQRNAPATELGLYLVPKVLG
ncbi:MAG: Asp-tRNA(Asn)/Glu-tRNA(Gln) amidotransferase subunit GatC [Gammaproteobacteria bacterium]|nr:MAG: Asp-tRNA(Asn)/Glu-tRNA(Gln) amidotransferase subunit GatC [Gammaproteobacteria bacterium]